MKPIYVVPAAAVAAVLLAACAGSGTAAASTPAPGSPAATTTMSPTATAGLSAGVPNATDIAFVTGMIAHHRGAIEMAGLARDRAGGQRVKDLAAAIPTPRDRRSP